jgi:hypothetical protein
MSGKQLLRTEVGERVDHPDFEFLSEISHRDAVNQIMEALVVGTDDVLDTAANTHPKFFVLGGFRMSVPSGANVLVEKDVPSGTSIQPGAAIMAFRDRGAAKFGVILSGGDASRLIDITTFPNGLYGIFVRFAFKDDVVQSRLVWNPITPTPVETPRSMPTRKSENWEIAIELVQPGPEWMRIGSVDRATMVITDERNFLFEGRAANSYAAVDEEWGTAVDRNSDRALHGASSIYKAIRGLQRQVQDIIGETSPNGWWRSIERSLKVALVRDGSRTMQGNLHPDATNTRNLGGALAAWAQIFVGKISLGSFLLGSDADADQPRVSAAYSGAAGREKTLMLYSDRDASSAWPLAIYRAQVGLFGGADAIQFVWNALYANATNLWTQTNAGNSPLLIEFGRHGFAVFRKDPEVGAGGTFTDIVGPAGWSERGARFLFNGTTAFFHELIAPVLRARAGVIHVDDDEDDAPADRSTINLNGLAASTAKRHAILSNYVANTLELRGGLNGDQAIKMSGLGVQLARNCIGQNGLYEEFGLISGTVTAGSIPAGGFTTITLTTATSPAINIGDHLVYILPDTQTAFDSLFNVQASVSGVNTITVYLGNFSSVAKPAANRIYNFDVLVLRRVTG